MAQLTAGNSENPLLGMWVSYGGGSLALEFWGFGPLQDDRGSFCAGAPPPKKKGKAPPQPYSNPPICKGGFCESLRQGSGMFHSEGGGCYVGQALTGVVLHRALWPNVEPAYLIRKHIDAETLCILTWGTKSGVGENMNESNILMNQTYIDRNNFQNYTTHELTTNNYALEFISLPVEGLQGKGSSKSKVCFTDTGMIRSLII